MSTTSANDMSIKPSLAKSLLAVALVTAAILIIPLVAMRFTDEVSWTTSDFVVMGVLLSFAGMVMTVALRKIRTPRIRLLTVGLIGLGFLYCWAEMAVGIFTNLGS